MTCCCTWQKPVESVLGVDDITCVNAHVTGSWNLRALQVQILEGGVLLNGSAWTRIHRRRSKHDRRSVQFEVSSLRWPNGNCKSLLHLRIGSCPLIKICKNGMQLAAKLQNCPADSSALYASGAFVPWPPRDQLRPSNAERPLHKQLMVNITQKQGQYHG